METKEIKGKEISAEELKEILREECKKKGISLTEDELNEKVIELCQMDKDAEEHLSGGLLRPGDCDGLSSYCRTDFMCAGLTTCTNNNLVFS